MAEREELEHLTCSICLEIFNEPKILPCCHRFCESCLHKYINSSTNHKQGGFHCPFCKQFTESPNPRRPRSAWAALFRTDFVIRDLISCRLKELSGPKHPCPAHTKIECDYYCFDCSQMMCHHCALKIHRSCVDVMTLPEAANQRQALLEAVINRVTTELEDREPLKELLAKYNSCIDGKACWLEADITIWADGVRKLVKDKEDQLLEQLKKKCNDLKQKIQSEVMKVKETEDQVQCRLDTAVSKLKLSHADILLDDTVIDAMTYCHDVDLVTAEENMTRICENLCSVRTHFQEMKTASMLLGNILMSQDCDEIVRLYGVSQDSRNRPENKRSDMADNVQVLSTIDVAGAHEDSSAYIHGMIIVDSDQTIIVTDYNRKCLKSFYNGGEVVTTLLLASGPSSVTQVGETTAAVSLPQLGQINIIKMLPCLKVDSRVQCARPYWALASLSGSTLVAAACTPSTCVDIISLNGQVLKSFTVNRASQIEMCTYPVYMCVTSDKRILVSGRRSQSLVCLSQDGEIQFRYTPVRYPKGVACDSAGCILLVNEEELMSLTPDGQFSKLLISSEGNLLSSPGALAVDTKGLVYVVNKWCEVKVLKIT